jgi:hypothetical protein
LRDTLHAAASWKRHVCRTTVSPRSFRNSTAVRVGRDAAYRVVERVQEHPASELAVRDEVQTELDLAPYDLLDRGVGNRAEVDGIGPRRDGCWSGGGRSRLPTISARAGRRVLS